MTEFDIFCRATVTMKDAHVGCGKSIGRTIRVLLILLIRSAVAGDLD